MTTPDEERRDAPTALQQGAPADVENGSPDDAEPAWTKLLAPFRSEDAAFRVLIAVVVICAAIAAIALALRAI